MAPPRSALLLLATLALLEGCASTEVAGPTTRAAREVKAIPPAPPDILAQRVRYESPNLLPGDTSFELPGSEYAIVCHNPAAASSRPTRSCRRTDTLAVHGEHAMRVFWPGPRATWVLYWPGVRIEPGRTYTFSAYLRGGPERATVQFVLDWRGKRSVIQSAHPSRSWRRSQASFLVPPDTPRQDLAKFFPAIVVSGPQGPQPSSRGNVPVVDVDAVQLEVGAVASPYRPRRPVDYGAVAVSESNHALPKAGRPLAFECAVRNNTAETIHLQFVWQHRELFGEPSAVKVLNVRLLPGRTRPMTLDFGLAHLGYHVLKTDVRGGVDLGLTDEIGFVVSDSSGRPASRSGSYIGEADLLDAADLTPPAVASRPAAPAPTAGPPRRIALRWCDVETLPGRDEFERADAAIDSVIAAGDAPVLWLQEPAPSTSPTWAVRHLADGGPLLDRRQFRQFVYRLASHLRGRVVYWECPIFSPQTRAVWTEEFCQAVKLAAPAARVLGLIRPPRAASRSGDLNPPLLQGLPSYPDVLLHTLWTSDADGRPLDWTSLDRTLAGLSHALKEEGRRAVPHWEVTPVWPWSETTDLETRATQIHRVTLLLKKHGVSHWLVPGPLLADLDTPRDCPVEAAACAAADRRLAGARYLGERPIGRGVTALSFVDEDGEFAALVLTPRDAAGDDVAVSIPDGVSAANLFGRTLSDASTAMTLKLGLAPIYLKPVPPQSGWLDGVAAVSGTVPQ